MRPNPTIDTALHVLKGSVQRVLNATLTTGIWAEGDRGRLTVQFDRKPTEEEMGRIEGLSNGKIAEDAPVEMFEMERGEAEMKFGKIIYDRFPVPPHVKVLTITRMGGWNINCCLGPHLKTTGEIGKLTITKHRFRAGRGELEISFTVK